MKLTVKYICTDGELQNFKEPAAEGDTQMAYYSDYLCSQCI